MIDPVSRHALFAAIITDVLLSLPEVLSRLLTTRDGVERKDA